MEEGMQKPKIKICGMRYLPNVKEILEFKPDYLGFIFYMGSRRFTAAHEMERIIKLDFGNTKRIGVFVNEELDIVLDFYSRDFFSIVQLHGEESPEYAAELKRKGLKVIKAISVGEDFDPEILEPYKGTIDYFLFDTKGRYRGGNGWKFDWNTLKEFTHEVPFFLSGGLKPEDIEQAAELNIPELQALDFNSQLETKPGIKNLDKVDELMQAMKTIDQKTLK